MPVELIVRQIAIRMKDWKAIRPRPDAEWELYDLIKDISEANNVAGENPKFLAQMKAFASEAHVDVVEGTFTDTANHQKDRAAKYGSTRLPQRPGRGKWKTKGLIASKGFKILSVSSENRGNGKFAVSYTHLTLPTKA